MRVIIVNLGFVFLSVVALRGQDLSGFSKDDVRFQADAEKKFDGYLRAANLDSWMRKLAARPHHLGSAYGRESAEFIRDQFRSWGYDAEIETFHVLFPTPRIRLLEMTSPKKFRAKLGEPALREDATSGQIKEQLPVYNCWSPDGDVTGQVVFVNYGLPADYEELERLGIDVKGKIVIARYGHRGAASNQKSRRNTARLDASCTRIPATMVISRRCLSERSLQE
jgi:N-acetylated-alpha-linked acidic dipeptidase